MSFNIRNKFLIPTLILVFFGMGVSSMVSYFLSTKALKEANINRIVQTANTTAMLLQSWFIDRKLDVANWAKQSTYVTALNDNFLGKAARKTTNEDFARLKGDYKYYEEICLADPSGALIAASDETILDKIKVQERIYFQEALKGKVYVSKVSKSKHSGNPVVFVAAPVLSKGKVGGVLFAVIDMTSFNAKFVDPIKIGKTGFAFIIDRDGFFIAHPDKDLVFTKNVKELGYGTQLLTGKDAVVDYEHLGVAKVAALKMYDAMGWTIGLNITRDEIYEAANRLKNVSIILVLGMVAASAVVIYLISTSVVKPINRVVAGLRDAAEGEGDLTKRLEVTSRDEVGELSQCFNVFVEKVQGIIKDIQSNLTVLNDSANSLSGVSENLARGSDDSSMRSNTVATAAEELNANINSVAAACEQASVNVNMVASAAEEMSATVNEISKNTIKAREISEQAVSKTETASERMNELGGAAQEISKVTETITEISEQTNLLALNATIEAARAGEAGKGFAVVANEIKELAKQTAQATQGIRTRIDAIQSSTSITVTEMSEINMVINEVNAIVGTIATAVEEQAASTSEIAMNVSQAALGINEVNENVAQTSSVSGEISREISEVSVVSGEINKESTQVKNQANDLLHLAGELRATVNQFKL